jgi:hypothetical protein
MRTVVLPALFVIGCAGPSAQHPAPPLSNRAVAARPPAGGSEDDAVRLAVFRYLVDHNASGRQPGVPFICLEVSGGDHGDPSPFIIAAMNERKPRAVPGSACESSVDGVFLKDDHAQGRGLIFSIEQVTIDGDKATVSGGYYAAGLSASGNIYTVERQPDGRWKVTADALQWIS